jgi:deoxyguanosine kinase
MPELFQPPRYIAVEGPIRVGKSTLTRILAERMNARRILEPEDNPHLAAFYSDEPGAALRTQMHFLLQRYGQLQGVGPKRSVEPIVADYIFEKDKLFAYLNLSDEELAVYNLYYALFRPQIASPDLVIYLQASPEVLKRRVARKNLAAEQAISDDYLEEVVKAYDHFFFHYTQSDLLIINTTEIDFVERNEDLQALLQMLSEPVRGTQYFLPLSEGA